MEERIFQCSVRFCYKSASPYPWGGKGFAVIREESRAAQAGQMVIPEFRGYY